jgi:hypothetical protein
MRFYCEWQEEATVRQNCSGWVEAESEEEAIKEVKKGNVDIDDCTVWDELDLIVTDVDIIYKDE